MLTRVKSMPVQLRGKLRIHTQCYRTTFLALPTSLPLLSPCPTPGSSLSSSQRSETLIFTSASHFLFLRSPCHGNQVGKGQRKEQTNREFPPPLPTHTLLGYSSFGHREGFPSLGLKASTQTLLPLPPPLAITLPGLPGSLNRRKQKNKNTTFSTPSNFQGAIFYSSDWK